MEEIIEIIRQNNVMIEKIKQDIEEKIEYKVTKVSDLIHDDVTKLASTISKKILVPDNDSGPFNSEFCWKIRLAIEETVRNYLREKTK